ncbi:MAG TPA: hypothetical protein VIU15_47145 [Streptomyces sp.]
MKALWEVLGFIALLQGGMGLLHEFTGWDIGMVQRVDLFDGAEIYVSVALVALACALFAVARRGRPD